MDSQAPKSVQDYIDETPLWADGTRVTESPMTKMQAMIFWLACAGKFFEGMVIFMTGVALPLIVMEFGLSSTEKGVVSAVSLFGILIGALGLGGLADLFGRKAMFITEMLLFVIFLVLVAISPNFYWLVVCLFGMGLALGCDYPTAHLMLSESIPSIARGRLVLSAFGFQSVGALAGTLLGFVILQNHGELEDWRWMFAAAIIPAMLVLIGRFFVPQSGHWLVAKGKVKEAEAVLDRLLDKSPKYPKQIVLSVSKELEAEHPKQPAHFGTLFSKQNRRATILASLPWFLQDLGTYGIGIFTPTILAATIGTAGENERNLAEVIHSDVLASKGAALIDLLLIAGIIAAIFLADKVGRMKLQMLGFVGCAVGLFLAACSTFTDGSLKYALIFGGFMLFNFMTNLGPNAMTYLIAGEVFPTRVRGMGAGFAAAFGKVGAVLTAFLFPILLHEIGTSILLFLLVGASLLGALVTWWFRIETRGVNLETIGRSVGETS